MMKNQHPVEFLPEILSIIIEYLHPDDYNTFQQTSTFFYENFYKSPQSLMFEYEKKFQKLPKNTQKLLLQQQEKSNKKKIAKLAAEEFTEIFWKNWDSFFSSSQIKKTKNPKKQRIGYRRTCFPKFSSPEVLPEMQHLMNDLKIVEYEKITCKYPVYTISTTCVVQLQGIELKFSLGEVESFPRLYQWTVNQMNHELIFYHYDENNGGELDIHLNQHIEQFNQVVENKSFEWEENDLLDVLSVMSFVLVDHRQYQMSTSTYRE
jgi:hypothetical protein